MVDNDRTTDLIDLVMYTAKVDFRDALKIMAEIVGISYYHDFKEDIPESLLLTQEILGMNENKEENEIPLKVLSPSILTYYQNYVNDFFYKDGISYEVQQEFGIGYDDCTNRITIPIYSEIGDLVGVKGRLLKEQLNEEELKYIYLEPTPRYRVLFGLNKTMNYINNLKTVCVTESEKGVMQLWSYGFYNSVGTGGKTISRQQINMLIKMNVKIILCFDKDVTLEDLKKTQKKFEGIDIYAIFDNENILNEKESPTDNEDKWNYLVKNCVIHLGDTNEV